MATLQEPTPEQAVSLFKEIEDLFPHKTLGGDKWYLVAVSSISITILRSDGRSCLPSYAWSRTLLQRYIPTSSISPNSKLPSLEKLSFDVFAKLWSRMYLCKECANLLKQSLASPRWRSQRIGIFRSPGSTFS